MNVTISYTEAEKYILNTYYIHLLIPLLENKLYFYNEDAQNVIIVTVLNKTVNEVIISPGMVGVPLDIEKSIEMSFKNIKIDGTYLYDINTMWIIDKVSPTMEYPTFWSSFPTDTDEKNQSYIKHLVKSVDKNGVVVYHKFLTSLGFSSFCRFIFEGKELFLKVEYNLITTFAIKLLISLFQQMYNLHACSSFLSNEYFNQIKESIISFREPYDYQTDYLREFVFDAPVVSNTKEIQSIEKQSMDCVITKLNRNIPLEDGVIDTDKLKHVDIGFAYIKDGVLNIESSRGKEGLESLLGTSNFILRRDFDLYDDLSDIFSIDYN